MEVSCIWFSLDYLVIIGHSEASGVPAVPVWKLVLSVWDTIGSGRDWRGPRNPLLSLGWKPDFLRFSLLRCYAWSVRAESAVFWSFSSLFETDTIHYTHSKVKLQVLINFSKFFSQSIRNNFLHKCTPTLILIDVINHFGNQCRCQIAGCLTRECHN